MQAKLPSKFYTWIGLLAWLILGAAAVVNMVVDKKAGGKPQKTFIARCVGHGFFLLYAIITLVDIVFKIEGMSNYAGMWKISVYILYITIIVSLVGLILPIVKGMNKGGESPTDGAKF